VPYRSLGSGPTWPTQGPQATLNAALNNLALAGLVVVVSAGNDGGLGSTSLGMCVPSDEPHDLAVHSSDPGHSCCDKGSQQVARVSPLPRSPVLWSVILGSSHRLACAQVWAVSAGGRAGDNCCGSV